MNNAKERKEYKNIFENLFKKKIDLSEKMDASEFNIEFIRGIAKEYRSINEEKIKLNNDYYYNQEKIRLKNINKQLEGTNYDNTVISRITSAIIPVFTFGIGLLYSLANEGVRNLLSQYNQTGNSQETITQNVNAISDYIKHMSNNVTIFVEFYVGILIIAFLMEHFINRQKKIVNERKIRFNGICLDVLDKINEI